MIVVAAAHLALAAPLPAAQPAVEAPPRLAPDARGASAPDRTFDMEKLELNLTLRPESRSVAGTATWTVRRLSEGPLLLDEVGLVIEDVRADGAPAAWYVRGEQLVVSGLGDRARVEVRYSATPRTGLHFREVGSADAYAEVWSQGEANDNRHWFPGWDHPNDRFVYEGAFTAPPGWKVLTNSGMDLVNYLVMVAAGPYEVHGDDQVSVWVPPGTSEAGWRRVLDPIPAMMAHFAARTGVPYPWGPYRQVFVQRFLYTGMENTSATVEDRWMVSNARVHGTRAAHVDSVVAHELAHQWYGDLLTCRDWRELWLNEGFATFFAADWRATLEGPDGWAAGVRRRYRSSLATQALARRFHAGPDAPDNGNVYNKGASVLQMLRVMLGEDVFWRAIRRYTLAHQRALVDSEDLRDAMEAESGQELGWFFQQWVELPYVPSLTVTTAWDAGRLTVNVRQDTTDKPTYTLPVEIEVPTPSGPITRRVWLEDEDVELHVDLPVRPAYVAFDPRGGLLAHVTQEQEPSAWAAQLESPSPYARIVALEHLGDTPETSPVSAVATSGSASEPLRVAAIHTLGVQRATAALLPFLDAPEDTVRFAAAEALGEGVGRAAVPALTAVIERDPNPDVAGAALRALANLDGDTAARLARPRLRLEAVEENRLVAAAAAVLGEHGQVKDVAALLRVTGPERARTHALRAAAALASRQDAGSSRDILLEQVARAAEGLLDDTDQRAREAALAILDEVGDAASVRLLLARRVSADREERDALDDSLAAIRRRATPTATKNELEARLQALEDKLEALSRETEGHH
jgi:aminopeptidase N